MADQEPAALNQRGLACYFGSGVAKDLVRAREFFLRAAEQNYTPAQVNLGLMYDHGDGVPRDYQAAMGWYKRAADLGDRDGRQMLGYMYFYGLGTQRDPQKAMYYFIAAAGEIPLEVRQALSAPASRHLPEVAAR